MSDPQAENESDGDSALGVGESESTCSLSLSDLKTIVENGRTYHGEGKYPLPNDEPEQNRLDLQHHLSTLTFDGKLFNCPIDKEMVLHRVLDVGTGTGIWAMDFADNHPQSNVVGVDLSPIQPIWVPPNVRFELDDLEEEWKFSDPFAFIHCGNLNFAISNWPRLLKQSFDNLESGGWIEVVDVAFPVVADDESIAGTHLQKWSTLLVEASERAGRRIDGAKLYKKQLEEAGFENVVEITRQWPQNEWPRSPKYKTLGKWTRLNFGHSGGLVDGCIALFTRYLNWSPIEYQVLSALVKNDLKNKTIHAYWKIYVVYGRKPLV